MRKIFAHANSDFQRAGELEGGLSREEFKQLLDKFNIPMLDVSFRIRLRSPVVLLCFSKTFFPLAHYTSMLTCRECRGLALFFLFFVVVVVVFFFFPPASLPIPYSYPCHLLRQNSLISPLSLPHFFNFVEQSEFQKLYDTLDPDGSGVLTYAEFQTAFGEEISSGASSIR